MNIRRVVECRVGLCECECKYTSFERLHALCARACVHAERNNKGGGLLSVVRNANTCIPLLRACAVLL